MFSAGLVCSSAMPAHDLHFTRISIEAGLSQSTIFSVTQDRTGSMWFATYDGVNRYDGYEFTVYHHVPGDDESIADDITRTLCTDLAGRVWVGTESGLSLYDDDLDNFHNFTYKGEPCEVNVVCPLTDSMVMVAMSDRVSVFDVGRMEFRDDVLPVSMLPLKVTAAFRGSGKIFLGTAGGEVHVYEPESNACYPVSEFSAGGGGREYSLCFWRMTGISMLVQREGGCLCWI